MFSKINMLRIKHLQSGGLHMFLNLFVLEIITGCFVCSRWINYFILHAFGWLFSCDYNCEIHLSSSVLKTPLTQNIHTACSHGQSAYITHTTLCRMTAEVSSCSRTQAQVCFCQWLQMGTKTKMHKYVGWRQQRAKQNSSNASLSVLRGAENKEYAFG